MKLSNGRGLKYQVVKAGKVNTDEGAKFTFTLVDPHTDKQFDLPELTKEQLDWLGYKLVK